MECAAYAMLGLGGVIFLALSGIGLFFWLLFK